MADALPQIRVRSDTQSRDAVAKVDASTRQGSKDSANAPNNGQAIIPENAEGTHFNEPPVCKAQSADHVGKGPVLRLFLQRPHYQMEEATQTS